ncbi:phosphohistidine phosphatase SixA [Alcanivorax sp. 1008]|uniref:phosphohistidine phosphatase SixA n=1 Tax=Alcanivorax sp. 1008 TaxID=2816853 RepID=UPI001D63D29F|nr:phosphohistidine phosphatase SixA [Alcanivorax sp. 1008]MCC1497581.1 phosphohistidine phosphatase SixA [Alcanivorax sp. 1008]
MRLYIVRHGEAEGQTTTDQARALTQRGREDVAQLWQALSQRGVTPSKLITSPYVRARQTADIIAMSFPQVARGEMSSITPDGEPAQVIEELIALRADDGWTLVSHMPFVDLLCGVLVDGQRYPFPVGAVACVDVDVMAPGGGRLLWLRSPADMR